MFDADKGKLAFIVKDCRDGEPATGKHGICEGDLPVAIAFKYPGKKWAECCHDNANFEILKSLGFVESQTITEQVAQELGYTLPMRGTDETAFKVFGEIEEKAEEIRKTTPHYYIRTNPRILLEDGSHIWGYECWWKIVESPIPPEKLQEVLEEGEKSITNFCQLFAGLLNHAKEETDQHNGMGGDVTEVQDLPV